MSTTEPSDNADLEIEVIPLDSGINVALEGELDIATAPVLHEELSELVTLGCIDLTLDLAELRFIDWPGLSVLTMTQKRVEQMGGSLVVVHPTRAALKLFNATGLKSKLMSTGRADDLIRFGGEHQSAP